MNQTIKSRFKRSLGRSLVLLTLTLALSNEAFAQDVADPGSLNYEIYSSTAAELFWDRSATFGLTYEVKRDGQILNTVSGVSYFDNTLSAGQTYRYDVIAVDPQGIRSDAATVSLTTSGGEPNSQSPVDEPQGLSAEVYSSNSVELFWTRPATFGLVYEISRDAVMVRTTDGVSFYDDSLSAGQSYRYQVVAVDLQGNRSPAASVTVVTTGGSTPGSTTPGGTTPPVSSVTMPDGLRVSIYSSSAAELFWERSETFGINYDVLRNGTSVQTTSGISYFDDDLNAGSSYTFEVIAKDGLGNQSAPATIMFNTAGGTVPSAPTNNPTAAAISEPEGYFDTDGYDTVNVIRLDVRTVTTPGVCTPDDLSGCTLDDVNADIDGDDDFTVDIPIHFQGEDLPDDGLIVNAELRQRGGFSRLAPQKSYRVKLDSKENLWRREGRLQMNKMPYDQSRIRNKLSFDLMQDIPHLPSLRTQFVNLWIDDGQGPEDYGLFTHTEYVGKEYLVNRERNEDDNIYKIEEFVFALSDLDYLAVDENGEPLDTDRFETRLDIKRGDDHRKVTDMIKAVNDQSRSFESILEQYFDEDNVLTWVTVNFLLHQMDAVTHNFYLYNPLGSDTFYFMPWDYDGTFRTEQAPANSFETDELMRRLYYGLSKGRASNFLNRYYRQPGIYRKIVDKAAELRNTYLTDSEITERATRYSTVVSTYAGRMPDVEHNATYSADNSREFASYVARCYEALLNYGIPFPPKWLGSENVGDQVVFEWSPAHDIKENTVTYDIEISSSPAFGADDQLLLVSGIAESESEGFAIDASRIGSGTRYARLVARSAANPGTFWQIASTRPVIDGQMRVGVMMFSVP